MRELNIDAKHNQAIRREIRERLWGLLREQPEVPALLRELVRQFGEDGDRALPRQAGGRADQARPRFACQLVIGMAEPDEKSNQGWTIYLLCDLARPR
jgi:hypothetical protein